jgi:hypothetical protein
MTSPRTKIMIAVLALTTAVAYAEVARSAFGKGATKTEAISAAKGAAQDKYRDSITGWGAIDCSQKTGKANMYAVNDTTWWECSIDYTTKN